jgi:hypothetical protein
LALPALGRIQATKITTGMMGGMYPIKPSIKSDFNLYNTPSVIQNPMANIHAEVHITWKVIGLGVRRQTKKPKSTAKRLIRNRVFSIAGSAV